MRVLLDVLSVCILILGGLIGRRIYQQLKPWPTGSGPTHYGSVRPK
jgi:hypothetical protein